MTTTSITATLIGCGWTDDEAERLDELVDRAAKHIQRAQVGDETLLQLRNLLRSTGDLRPMLEHVNAQAQVLHETATEKHGYSLTDAEQGAALRAAGLWGGPFSQPRKD